MDMSWIKIVIKNMCHPGDLVDAGSELLESTCILPLAEADLAALRTLGALPKTVEK